MQPEDLGTYYELILDKEVRKVGGVYYTPPLIVDYMVEIVKMQAFSPLPNVGIVIQ